MVPLRFRGRYQSRPAHLNASNLPPERFSATAFYYLLTRITMATLLSILFFLSKKYCQSLVLGFFIGEFIFRFISYLLVRLFLFAVLPLYSQNVLLLKCVLRRYWRDGQCNLD